MKVVVGALDTRMAHVSGKVWEFRGDICTRGDPSVEVSQSEMVTKVIGPRPVTKSLQKTCILPDSAEYQAYAAASVTFRSGCREEVDSAGIDFGDARVVAPEEFQKILRYGDSPTAVPFRADDVDCSAWQLDLLDARSLLASHVLSPQQ